MTAKRWRELYEAALAEIRRESQSPPGSVYDWDDRESATKIATLRYRRETLRRIEEERAKAKLPASSLTADELRRLIPGAPDTALAALVLKAQLIAHPDHGRPRLVVNNPRVDASSPKLTDKQMREAISLGVKMAEADALPMLERKARQLAELDRRRPGLVIDRDRIEPRQV